MLPHPLISNKSNFIYFKLLIEFNKCYIVISDTKHQEDQPPTLNYNS